MPLFISDEEFSRCSDNAALVAEKADAFIRGLLNDLETIRAKADASDINAEQNCTLVEQKYVSLSAEYSKLEAHVAELQSALDQRLIELSEVQSQKPQIQSPFVEKDGEIERLRTEVDELHKSKRQLIELVEQKDLVISEKNATIKSYLDKIVYLSESAAQKEARLSEAEAELARIRAACARLSEVERQFNECSISLQWNKDKVRELEQKLKSVQEELISAKDAAAANEERFSAELSTNMIVDRATQLQSQSIDASSSSTASPTHIDEHAFMDEVLGTGQDHRKGIRCVFRGTSYGISGSCSSTAASPSGQQQDISIPEDVQHHIFQCHEVLHNLKHHISRCHEVLQYLKQGIDYQQQLQQYTEQQLQMFGDFMQSKLGITLPTLPSRALPPPPPPPPLLDIRLPELPARFSPPPTPPAP